MITIEKILCPVADGSCPYFKMSDGSCSMFPEADPSTECDDFAFMGNDGNYVMKEVGV
jgi:hypothetical protein